jgi:hypothetical protein
MTHSVTRCVRAREREDDEMVDLVEARRCLAALVAAVEAGKLVGNQVELAGLRGALVVMEHLKSVQNTTV